MTETWCHYPGAITYDPVNSWGTEAQADTPGPGPVWEWAGLQWDPNTDSWSGDYNPSWWAPNVEDFEPKSGSVWGFTFSLIGSDFYLPLPPDYVGPVVPDPCPMIMEVDLSQDYPQSNIGNTPYEVLAVAGWPNNITTPYTDTTVTWDRTQGGATLGVDPGSYNVYVVYFDPSNPPYYYSVFAFPEMLFQFTP